MKKIVGVILTIGILFPSVTLADKTGEIYTIGLSGAKILSRYNRNISLADLIVGDTLQVSGNSTVAGAKYFTASTVKDWSDITK